MFALALAAFLHSQAVPPRGPQTVEEVQAISRYIAAVSTKASLLRSCSDFVEPNSISEMRSELIELPEVAHVKEKFAELVDAMITSRGADMFDGEPTSEKCRTLLGYADSSMEELLPAFRATLPVFVGQAEPSPMP
jgi:hypothetical protein